MALIPDLHDEIKTKNVEHIQDNNQRVGMIPPTIFTIMV